MASGYMEEINELIGKGPELNFEIGRPHSNVSLKSINCRQICSQTYLTGNFNFACKMHKSKNQERRKLRNLIEEKPMFLKMQKISPFS